MKANLTRVTFTGADDTVSPEALIDISKSWPHVEWGILIGSQHGHRFPSENWITRLLLAAPQGMNLSLHICGKHLRDIAAGKGIALYPKMTKIARCQLNWHAEKQGDIANSIYRAFKEMESAWNPEVIFQLDGVNDTLACESASKFEKRIAGLFDLSHGAGVLPKEWPACTDLSAAYPVGYAGGLGPDNLREQLSLIHSVAAGDYWIDMETKLYNGLQFSLEKCVDVLKIVDEFKAKSD